MHTSVRARGNMLVKCCWGAGRRQNRVIRGYKGDNDGTTRETKGIPGGCVSEEGEHCEMLLQEQLP